jgi:hypothetical protein
LNACTLFISGIYLSNNRFAAFADLVSMRETGKSLPTEGISPLELLPIRKYIFSEFEAIDVDAQMTSNSTCRWTK